MLNCSVANETIFYMLKVIMNSKFLKLPPYLKVTPTLIVAVPSAENSSPTFACSDKIIESCLKHKYYHWQCNKSRHRKEMVYI